MLLFYAPEIFSTITSSNDSALLDAIILGGAKLVSGRGLALEPLPARRLAGRAAY